MIDVLHLVQLSLLRFGELVFPVFVKQLTRPLDVGLRRPECNDFLRPGSAGKKLDDFAPVRRSAVTVLRQTALDDFLKFRALRLQSASELVRQINGHLNV